MIPVPLRLLSAVPKATIETLDRCAVEQRARGLHDPCVYLSSADVCGAIKRDSGARHALSIPDADEATQLRHANLIVALASWRRTQGIYRVDETLFDEVAASGLKDLPSSAFRRLPEPCVWVEKQGSSLGFFALVDDTSAGMELTILAFIETSFALRIHIPLDLPLEDAVQRALGSSFATLDDGTHAKRANEAVYGGLAAITMYLCSEEPDVQSTPSRLNAKRLHTGQVPFHPTEHCVGYRMGAAFRAARDAAAETGVGVGRSPVPHIRRAHWHTFLKGPRDEERQRVVKWLPPIPVNLASLDDLVAVVRPVKA